MDPFWDCSINIVLHEPEIPGNTGTIGRLCVGCNASLTLIEPLGFSLDDKYLRRAGLDYWPKLKWRVLPNWDHFYHEMEKLQKTDRLFYCSTKAQNSYSAVTYQRGDFLIFGKETKGLPESLLTDHPAQAIKIPMTDSIRSINLAIATGIITYEALRQTGEQL